MKIVSLVVAEDDQDDQVLIKEAFEECGIDTKSIVFVADGEELIAQLNADCARNSLVILDLNMPKKDGREALKEIRAKAELKHIPVIILSTSHNEQDVKFTYKNGANTYFIKPDNFSDLVTICRNITNYWTVAEI